jgi:RNA polymerase sigma-70 factor, ECF subfamily
MTGTPHVQMFDALAERLYGQADGSRWSLPPALFTAALQASIERTFSGRTPSGREIERYLASLHLQDLALACACAAGHDPAWEHFIRHHRPLLYRCADALDSSGGARELADSLYADLFGTEERDGKRASLFRFFSGRSSLATWLRAVLSQRHVDRQRAARRLEPLVDDDDGGVAAPRAPSSSIDPDRVRLFPLLMRALRVAVARLDARDRLRLACYYSQDLTLAQTGRLLGEHEATVSRQLARSRRKIRDGVERHLRDEARLSDAEIAACFDTAGADPGALDVRALFGRKNSPADRSS